MNTSFNKNRMAWIVIMFGLIIGIYFFKNELSNNDQPIRAVSVQEISANKNPLLIEKEQVSHDQIIKNNPATVFAEVQSSTENIDPIEALRTVGGTPSEQGIIKLWEEARGRYSDEDLAEYKSYDVDTLRQLADSGDLKAMMALAQLLITPPYVEQYDSAEHFDLLNKAAVHGSTYALELYAITLGVNSTQGNTKIQHDALLEVLAWGGVAALRGDVLPNSTLVALHKDAYRSLTEKDKHAIHDRALTIYDNLQAERLKLGLGEFDNTIPSEVKRMQSYFQHIIDSP